MTDDPVILRAELEELRTALRDYLRHPSEDGSPLRREKRRKVARLLAGESQDLSLSEGQCEREGE